MPMACDASSLLQEWMLANCALVHQDCDSLVWMIATSEWVMTVVRRLAVTMDTPIPLLDRLDDSCCPLMCSCWFAAVDFGFDCDCYCDCDFVLDLDARQCFEMLDCNQTRWYCTMVMIMNTREWY